MSSRDIEDLQPQTLEKAKLLLVECRDNGLEILIYRTLCTLEDQAKLFRRGRSYSEIRAMANRLERQYDRDDISAILLNVGPQYGPKVTNAAPGMSMHNYGLALDAVPLRDGKPVWEAIEHNDLELWYRYGEAAERVGLVWGGRWIRFRDMPHVQDSEVGWEDRIRDYIFS